MSPLTYWALLITLAVFIDILIGDPLPHPVLLIGALIKFLERMNAGGHRKFKGCVLVILVLATVTAVVVTLEWLTWSISYALYTILNIWFLSTALAEKSLKDAGADIAHVLDHDIERARVLTGGVVGRETKGLDRWQIIRAAVETMAENGIDGVLAPLLYMILGIIPALYSPYVTPLVIVYIYKAVNTMDSMVGYIDEPYTEFGWAAAKLDDALNFFPARIGALYYLLAGKLLGYDLTSARRVYDRDKVKHPSPNAGRPEAAVAGLLGVHLGGNNVYFGTVHEKETIGESTRELERADISRAMKIVSVSEMLMMITFSILWVVVVLV